MSDYRFVPLFNAPVENGKEYHKNKYNWQLSEYAGSTGLNMVRRSSWQFQLAVI